MMIKQRRLAFFETECLETLWEQLPESARKEVTQHYARLMARASVAQIRALKTTQKNREMDDESSDG